MKHHPAKIPFPLTLTRLSLASGSLNGSDDKDRSSSRKAVLTLDAEASSSIDVQYVDVHSRPGFVIIWNVSAVHRTAMGGGILMN